MAATVRLAEVVPVGLTLHYVSFRVYTAHARYMSKDWCTLEQSHIVGSCTVKPGMSAIRMNRCLVHCCVVHSWVKHESRQSTGACKRIGLSGCAASKMGPPLYKPGVGARLILTHPFVDVVYSH